MKPSQKKKNVQPSIASFLFSKGKQPAAGSRPELAKSGSGVLSRDSSLQTSSSEPPQKKQRLSNGISTDLVQTPAAADSSDAQPALAHPSSTPAASEHMVPLQSSSQPLQPAVHGADDMEVEILPPQHDTAAVPPRQVARHIRLQHKLVENEGRRSRRSEVPSEPGKFTPLELQVIELRKRYPDVLLIIEVRSNAATVPTANHPGRQQLAPSPQICNLICNSIGITHLKMLWRCLKC